MRKPKYIFSNMLRVRPKVSEVLTAYLKQCNEPPWTSYFIRWKDVSNDQWGESHFNWTLPDTGTNYHILRTGCYPYMKYHCTRRPYADLSVDNAFFKALKVLNLGIPLLFYGLSATMLIRHRETVRMPNGVSVAIFFLYEEDKGSHY